MIDGLHTDISANAPLLILEQIWHIGLQINGTHLEPESQVPSRRNQFLARETIAAVTVVGLSEGDTTQQMRRFKNQIEMMCQIIVCFYCFLSLLKP